MRHRSAYLALAAAAILGLAGCGGGGGGDSTTSGGDGVAFYLDSPVIGAQYSCGRYSGYTGEDGSFMFEFGSGCTMSVAGITLREIPYNVLHNGKIIVETDSDSARLLQSLDFDANPDNGIYIAPEVTQALAEVIALGGYEPDTIRTDEATLAEVLEQIRAKVPSFQGELKTADEALAHACKTYTAVLKALIIGRTFYRYCTNGSDKWYQTYTFAPDGTLTIDNGGSTTTAKYTIDTKYIIVYSDVTHSYTLAGTTENSITLQDQNGETLTLYYSAEAASASDPVVCDAANMIVNDVASVIVGNTYYLPVKNSAYPHVETYTFSTDGSTVTVAWEENGVAYSAVLNYQATSTYLRIYGETTVNGQPSYIDKTYLGPVVVTASYIQFSSSDERFYKTYDAAAWALKN